MARTLVLSPSWRHRRELVQAWAVQHLDAIVEGRCLVLVGDGGPWQWLNGWLARRLAQDRPGAVLLPAPVRHVRQLGREVLLRCGRLVATPSPTERLSLIAASLADGDPALARYAGFSHRPVTCRALDHTLGVLRGERPNPDEWEAWAEQVAHRAEDLLALAALERQLASRLEQVGKMLPAAVQLAAAEALTADALGDLDHLVLYDTVPLGAAERTLLATVLERCPLRSVLAVLPGEADSPRAIFAADRPVVDLLQAAGCQLDAAAGPDEDSLASRLYRGGLATTGRPTLRRVVVPDLQRGLAAALAETRDLLTGGSVRPEQVAIVVPGLPSVADQAQALAERHGVPAAILAVREQPDSEAELLRKLMEAKAATWPRRQVVDLLTHPRVRHDLKFKDIAAFDRVALAAGIIAGPWDHWETEINQFDRTLPAVQKPSDADLESANKVLAVLRQQLGEASTAHPRDHRRHLTASYLWLTGVASAAATATEETETTDPAKRRELADPDDDLTAIGPLTRLLALDSWPSEQRLAPVDYVRLATALLQPNGRPDRPEVGNVLICEPGKLCGEAPQRVYLLGAVAGAFPRPGRAPVPFDLDDLSAMALAGGSDAGAIGGDDAARFLDLVTAAPELVLIEPSLDRRGDPAQPSPLIEELTAVWGQWPAPERVRSEERLPAPSAAADTVSCLAGVLQAAVDGTVPPVLPDDPQFNQGLEAAVRQARMELSRLGAPELMPAHNGILTGTPAGQLVAARWTPEAPMSPSSLEGYLAWPFGWLVSQVWELTEVSEPDGSLSPLVEGQVMHGLLRELVAAGGLTADPAQRVMLIGDILTGQCPEDARPPGIGAGLWRRIRLDFGEWLNRLAETDSGIGKKWPGPRTPQYLEQRFGLGEDGWPALRLDLTGVPLLVRGVVDRVDQTAGGWVVLDYKRTPAGNRGSFGKELQVQLPLYGLAVSQLAGDQKPVVGWALLSYRKPGAAVGDQMSIEDIDAATTQMVELLAQEVPRLRAGQFPPRPCLPADGRSMTYQQVAVARTAEQVGQGDDNE